MRDVRKASERDRAAASFYALLAFIVLAAALAGANVVLAVLSVVMGAAAIAALRGFPVDRTR